MPIEEDQPAPKAGGFAFLNVSNPSESLTAENRRRVRQHVRFGVSEEVRVARQAKHRQPKSLELRPAREDAGDSPFINISHPSQISAPQLVRFVRQQAQRKYRKDKPPPKNSVDSSSSSQGSPVDETARSPFTGQLKNAEILRLSGQPASPVAFQIDSSTLM